MQPIDPRELQGTSLFRTVHKPRVAIRAAPSAKAEIVLPAKNYGKGCAGLRI